MAITQTSSTTPTQDGLALVGRIMLAALFIPAGFSKIGGFDGVVGYISSVGLPLPQAGAALAILVELVLGIALLVGFKTRLVALLIALFTLAAAFFFHNYWGMPADKAGMQQIMFWKNIAIAGGLLAFTAFGPGRFSLDRR